MEAETERRMGEKMTEIYDKIKGHAVTQSDANPAQTLRDAAENLLIAIGMGWDIEGCAENLRAALAQSDAEPFDIDRDGIYDTDKGPPTYAEPVAWQLVPKNPTEKMLGAAANASDDDDWSSAMAKAYKAMLAVAPTPPRHGASAGLIEAAEFTDQLFSLAFDITPIESCEIMELGEKLGLLEQVAYDPKIHDGEIDADEGDLIYVRSAKGEALRARAADRSEK